jgi:glycerol-3-phosphate acyltransferase PlsY
MDRYFMTLSGPTAIIATLAAAAIGYLLGSIPFGLVITRMAGLGDIRAIGSGNIGATNVLRTGRKDLALATLLLDCGKAGLAFLAVYYGAQAILASGAEQARAHLPAGATVDLAPPAFSLALIAGAMAFIGHCFPVWLKFKGGKGVATFIGLLLAAMWQVGLAFGAIWLLVAMVFRMSSFSALVATFAAPFIVAFFGYGPFAVGITAALAVLIFWRHRANISRILSGTEPKIGAKKDKLA